MKKATFTFNTATAFDEGIRRLMPVLGFELGDGIKVTAEKNDHSGVSLHNGSAVISYTKKHQFFRQLGILCENASKGEFEHRDDDHFTEISIMLDASFGGVYKTDTVNRLLDRLALMGYSMAMLYTEDTVELESRPYFGYMRGRYSKEELKEMDDYAWGYGIELIPCIECYGHMSKYLRWGEASTIRDTSAVLLAREERTFAFLEEFLSQLKACFRSNRVHIGMDEAWDMGRGAFLDKHGYIPPFEIFSEYMQRLISITDKLGMHAMMWSDMYFRVSSGGNYYYDEKTEIPPEVSAQIPEDIELVFWHYGEEPQCDDYMMKKHIKLNREIIYAGGLWSWMGHFPEHNYMKESVSLGLAACRKNNIHRAMVTLWEYGDGDVFANLYGMAYFAELCLDPKLTEEKFATRFEAVTGGNAEAFYTMSLYHNRFENESFPDFNNRFFGKPLFYQDILEGLFDKRLWERPMSAHYAECAKKMATFTGGTWGYLYDFAKLIFEYLALKTKIAESLVPAYKVADRATLTAIKDIELPSLKKKTVEIHEMHRKKWLRDLKPFTLRRFEEYYAGIAVRCDTAAMLLDDYLSGRCEALIELEEPRLHHRLSGFFNRTGIVIDG